MAGSGKVDNSVIIQTTMEDVLHDSMIPYAEHVILERALPRVEDGLKPVQRRILYTMMELGMSPDKPYRKCARIVGDCLGKYHPHGDSSVYDALVRMAQPFSLRGMLVDGHGNFGSIDGDSAAAMRYTEARMTKLSMLMLKDIEKDTVPFRLNFDDTLKEPDMLPARFPNLLVNGANGIAVGLATNIPPHNLKEASAAVMMMIDSPDATVDELMTVLPAPDFPTGGVLLDTPEIKTAYETGRAKLQVRAKVHVEDGPAGRKLLVITEVPYQVSKAAMLKKILQLSEEKKAALGCIYDIRDESDRTGLRAVVELRKEADPHRVLAYLYKYSDLQVTFGVNMVAIADGKPMQLGIRAMLHYYIEHQKSVVTRRTRYDLDQAQARLHILEGLMIAVDHLDEVIALIRGSKNGKEAKQKLMERFELSEIQAQAILDLRLQRLTNLELLALRKEYEELCRLVKKLEAILASEKKLLGVIKDELAEIVKEFDEPRRTTIEKPDASPVPELDNTPVPDPAVVTYTFGGQLRRMNPKLYEKQAADMPQDAADKEQYVFATQTDHTLLFFTSLGNCYTVGVSALPEVKPKDRGNLLTGVLAGLENGEQLIYLMDAAPGQLAKTPDLLFITEQGMVKRSEAAQYDVRRPKFAAIALKGKDRLQALIVLDRADDLLLFSKSGMCIRFPIDTIPTTGRATGGVKGMQLEAEDTVFWSGQLAAKDQMVLFSERGSAKRIMAVDFEAQNRNGKGVKSFYFNKNGSNGTRLAGVCRIDDSPCTLLVLQAKSPATAISPSDIVLQGKQDRGMPCVMALMEDVVTGLMVQCTAETAAPGGGDAP